MESFTRVWLNNRGLQDIDPTIHISDVSYQSPSIETSVANHAKYAGARVMRQRMGANQVVVSFEIHEYGLQARQDVAQKVVEWAMVGGILTISDRPNQQLHVICTEPPSVSSTLRWTDSLTVSFTAYEQPFWEDVVRHSLTLTSDNPSGTLYGIGSAYSPYVEAVVTPSELMSNLTVTVGDTYIQLIGLSVASGDKLCIEYDDAHVLKIYDSTTGTSFISCRTSASSDDLRLTIGKHNNCSISSNAAFTAKLMTRGLYL